ncbi:diaminopimelate epimerase [Fibrobacterales bacterium]|nr:diaminopimelate epimerase [Fibrobacterales bacterium]
MIKFTKMQGAGNDYVYIDEREFNLESRGEKYIGEVARRVSDRHFGVGSDGLVLILPAQNAENHARMRMFNADGSEAEMCGNAVRCVARFVRERWNVEATPLRVETKSGVKVIQTKICDAGERKFFASVDMGEPVLEGDVELNGREFARISMGNPHAVTFVDNVGDAPVLSEGKELETNAIFPNKSNIEYVEFVSSKHIKMRVWERGAGETLACGTGACAAAVAAMLKKGAERSLTVELLGGNLMIDWREDTNRVIMTGGAEFVFEGEIA